MKLNFFCSKNLLYLQHGELPENNHLIHYIRQLRPKIHLQFFHPQTLSRSNSICTAFNLRCHYQKERKKIADFDLRLTPLILRFGSSKSVDLQRGKNDKFWE
ncbi:hypothetical protein V6N13_063327 [Hibiscus sabdariffa]